MDKSTPEKFARTMLHEMAQIRAVVESLHDINTNVLHQLSGHDAKQKGAGDRELVQALARQQAVIYASLLRRAGLTEPEIPKR